MKKEQPLWKSTCTCHDWFMCTVLAFFKYSHSCSLHERKPGENSSVVPRDRYGATKEARQHRGNRRDCKSRTTNMGFATKTFLLYVSWQDHRVHGQLGLTTGRQSLVKTGGPTDYKFSPIERALVKQEVLLKQMNTLQFLHLMRHESLCWTDRKFRVLSSKSSWLHVCMLTTYY